MTILSVGDGVMTVVLAGEAIDLLAAPGPAREVCRLFGGISPAYRKVNDFDFDSIVKVINAGAGRTGAAAKATEALVFEEGITTTAAFAGAYLGFLSNGGKAQGEPVAAAGAGEPAAKKTAKKKEPAPAA